MRNGSRIALLAAAAIVLSSCASAPSRQAAPREPETGAPPAQAARTGEPAAPPAPKKVYTAKEREMLTLCVGMTDTAWTAALQKKAGVSREEARARFASTPKADLALATVDKVYQEEFKNPWDYAVRFFREECALELAHVPADRARLAAYCMQNTMIASVAFRQRKAGATREQAYKQFEAFKSETPRRIVDSVYTGTGDRGATMLGEWESCIIPLSE
ncbi:MAG TPA: hypothetical protein VLU43_18825 [Anaeromyxobacteraceae bacterium]|nr:hypothetical protein [Anaeromyxobacteraceae bacterium]